MYISTFIQLKIHKQYINRHGLREVYLYFTRFGEYEDSLIKEKEFVLEFEGRAGQLDRCVCTVNREVREERQDHSAIQLWGWPIVGSQCEWCPLGHAVDSPQGHMR